MLRSFPVIYSCYFIHFLAFFIILCYSFLYNHQYTDLCWNNRKELTP
ncbi:hypothetical protein CLOSTHATH_01698 [Hungatella hathewayi DSM 13479]|uniref:Uncharacterized protein n=1 Tax=Hungatella hathewayi DSM 13479 TaxID=566550 RepID=D3ADL9_9FIRM|nr:hypothetical protein CLOSTHATH_01698 [Hungatella hathewayi DSM 13479]